MSNLELIKSKSQLLKDGKIFYNISDEDLKDLLNASQIIKTKKDEIIFIQNDPAEYFYIILEGAVNIFIEGQNGKETLLRITLPGDLIGKSALLPNSHYIANSQVLHDAILLKISSSAIKKRLDSNIKLLNNLLHSTLVADHDFIIKMARSLSLSAPKRLGCFLMKYGENNNNISLPFEKKVIASYLQMTPETMSRAITALKEYDVHFNNNEVIINNFAKLKNFCCNDCSQISSPSETSCES